jgi:hypothetical protein
MIHEGGAAGTGIPDAPGVSHLLSQHMERSRS